MTDATFGERVLADRKARKLSRGKYAELAQLTPAKIANLEKGRVPRPEEEALLLPLLNTTPAVATQPELPQQPEPQPQPQPQPEPEPEPDAPIIVDGITRDYLMTRYAEIYERLDGRHCAVPYDPKWGTPGDGPTEYFAAIVEWCAQVDRWLDALEPLPEGNVPSPKPGPDVEVKAEEQPPSECEGEDDEDDTALATVTEPIPVFPDDGRRRFSNGELRSFKRCRRRWWLSSYRKLGLKTEERTGAAPLGTRIHRCLSVYYVPDGTERGDPFAELERTYTEDMAVLGGDELKVAELRKERELAHAMLEGYFEWLTETGADEGITITASETSLDVDARLPSGDVNLIAKLDVRATRTFGDETTRLFIDHKTVGDLTTPTKMLAFDEQMLHYDLCEYLHFLESGMSSEDAEAVRTDGALYNMLRKVKRTATAKPPFYGRVEVRHNVHTLRSYWLRVKGTVDEIRELERKLDAGADPREVAYPTPTKDCSWDCDFYHVCTMFDDGSRAEDMLSSTFVTVDPHERYRQEITQRA